MKLSKTTLDLLKNFSTINQSIAIKKGNRLRTISVLRNIVADTIVDETFPVDFGINDLNQFQNSIFLFNNPELIFDNDKYLKIMEGSNSLKYYFGDLSLIPTPTKEVSLPSKDVAFSLSKDSVLSSILKASSIQSLPDLSVIGNKKDIKLVVRDKSNPTSNEYAVKVGDTDKNFEFNFKIENLKLYSGSYNVEISKSLVSKFKHKDLDLTYWVALEPDFKYDE